MDKKRTESSLSRLPGNHYGIHSTEAAYLHRAILAGHGISRLCLNFRRKRRGLAGGSLRRLEHVCICFGRIAGCRRPPLRKRSGCPETTGGGSVEAAVILRRSARIYVFHAAHSAEKTINREIAGLVEHYLFILFLAVHSISKYEGLLLS